MKYIDQSTPGTLPRCPYVDKPCIGEGCMAWQQRVDILRNKEVLIYKGQGYCGAIYKESYNES